MKYFFYGMAVVILVGGTGIALLVHADATSTPTSTPCTLSVNDFQAATHSATQLVLGTSTASLTLTNNTTCSAPINLASYKMFVLPNAPQWLSTQQIFDFVSLSVPPSSTETLTVSLPSCKAQIDGWFGTIPMHLLDSDPYSYPNVPYAFIYAVSPDQLCTNTPTPTSTIVDADPQITANSGGSGGGGNNEQTAEIGITKTVDIANPNPGDTIHYIVTVKALGPSVSQSVVATDMLPAGVTFISASSSVGTYNNSTGIWTLGNVVGDATATLVITATVNANDTIGQAITNTATVTESLNGVNDPLSGNNSSNATITVGGGVGGGGGTVQVGGGGGAVPAFPNTGLPSPAIHIVDTPSRLTPFPFGGGNVTYTYTVTNPGAVGISAVVVTDNTCGPILFITGDANANSLLDPGEMLIYTCQTNITISTKSIAMAQGTGNGFTVLAYASTTVLVSVPKFPDTGLPPKGK